MKTYQVELLDPKVERLLEELANLKLIKLQDMLTPKQEFTQLLTKIRASNQDSLSFDEITEEVELIRKKRYDQTNEN